MTDTQTEIKIKIVLNEFKNIKSECQGFDIEIVEMYRDALIKTFSNQPIKIRDGNGRLMVGKRSKEG